MSRPPAGFRVLAACAALYGVAAAAVTLGVGHPTWRGGPALMAALALVTAEALWNARPWAFRASVAFAGGYYLSLLIASPVVGIGVVLVVMALSAAFVATALAYVATRMAALRAPAGPVLRSAP